MKKILIKTANGKYISVSLIAFLTSLKTIKRNDDDMTIDGIPCVPSSAVITNPSGKTPAESVTTSTDVNNLAATTGVMFPFAYTEGSSVDVYITGTNTVPPFANINGLGAVPIAIDDVPVVAGFLESGSLVKLTYKNGKLQVPSDASIAAEVAEGKSPGLFKIDGSIDCSANPLYPAAIAGTAIRVSVAGLIGGGAGKAVAQGDFIVCLTDSAAGTQVTVGANWDILSITDDVATAIVTAAADATTKAGLAQSNAIATAATDATTKAGLAQSNAIAAAATDATAKAGLAQSNAISAAATDASAKAGLAQSNAITAAATDATTKDVAVTAAASADATTKAGLAQSNAISAASTDATTKAGLAQSNAITAAATDATTKDVAVTAAASADATTKASLAQSNAIAAAATDATTKDVAVTAAASADATTKAGLAQSNAIAAAATDATTKASLAQSNAIVAAATDATTKDVAVTAAASADATAKAGLAQSNAIAAASTDATTKDVAVTSAASADATTKAGLAQSNAIAAASTDATTKANNAIIAAASAISAARVPDLAVDMIATPGIVSPLSQNTKLQTTIGNLGTFNMMDPLAEGDSKKIIFFQKGGAVPAVLTPSNLHGGTHITFTNEGDSIELIFLGAGVTGKWYAIGTPTAVVA